MTKPAGQYRLRKRGGDGAEKDATLDRRLTLRFRTYATVKGKNISRGFAPMTRILSSINPRFSANIRG